MPVIIEAIGVEFISNYRPSVIVEAVKSSFCSKWTQWMWPIFPHNHKVSLERGGRGSNLA